MTPFSQGKQSIAGVAAGLWHDADRPLLRTAACIGTLAPISAALVFIDGRMLDGANLWLKPLKFQISTSVFLFTLALAMPLAGRSFPRSVLGRVTVWTAIVTAAFEIVWITFRAAIGERSHYAFDTAVGGVMYVLMGFAAVLLSLTPVVVAIRALLIRDDDPPRTVLRWGFALGTAVALAGATGVGIMLGGSPDHYPTDAADEASRVPVAKWSVERGDLRIAHFVGLHAMQGLFIAGMLLTRAPFGVARTVLISAAILWLGAVIALAALAVDGRSPLSPLASVLGTDTDAASPSDE